MPTSPFSVPLPKSWPKHAKAATLHIISLAHFVLTHVRGFAIYVAYLSVDGRFRHPWLREGSPGSPRSLGRKIGVADRVGIAKDDRVSESEGPGVCTSESLVSIYGDVSDDRVVARPRGRVQFSGVGGFLRGRMLIIARRIRSPAVGGQSSIVGMRPKEL